MQDSKTAVSAEASSTVPLSKSRFHQHLDYIAHLLHAQQYLFLTLASVIYFLLTCYRAQRRLFWFDEIFTVGISQLPDMESIWSACKSGADFHPPLFYLLTRWSQNLFGATELGTRIPEIIGFWVFCLCLYRFVSVRTNAMAGFIALLLPLTTAAYWYAYEARPYGIVLGFFGLALISWQAAATVVNHRWTLVAVMAASLTSAALCHCYSFVLFIALGLGELTRTFSRRRFDIWIWLALVLPAIVSIVVALSLLHSLGGTSEPNPATLLFPSVNFLLSDWDLSFEPRLTLSILLLFGVLALLPPESPVARELSGEGDRVASKFAWHEIAAICGILCAPLFAYLASAVAHTSNYGRYSLIVIGGVACLIAVVPSRSKLACLLVLCFTILGIGLGAGRFARGTFVAEPSTSLEVGTRVNLWRENLEKILNAAKGDDPIVLTSNLSFASVFYYASPALIKRVIYVTGDGDVNGGNYQRLQRYCTLPGAITTQSKFLHENRAFFVFGGSSEVDVFRRLGAQLTLQQCVSGDCLFRAVLPDNER